MCPGNSIIPTAAQHDRHYAHACTACDTEFTRHRPPAGEIHYNGIWADACPRCYNLLKEEEDEEPDAAHLLLTSLTAT